MPADTSEPRQPSEKLAVEHINQALQGLAYGSVEITVHDGRIVQIERREKTRLKIPVASGAVPSSSEQDT